MNMNNMTRFLSKREKDGSSHRRDKSRDKSRDRKIRPTSNESLLPNFLKSDSSKKVADKDTQTQIAAIKLRLAHFGYHKVDDNQIIFVLNSKHAAGDLDKAVELLVLFQQAVDGIIRPYDPKIKMRGSENRGAVTCYLDSVLFAMFARLTSFEPILHNTFEDEPRRRLATLIRLWVNMLRAGLLIHTDVTELIQDALKDCGWEEAALVEQQDTSEAFSFITETLQLPLLTLKMDIFHTGKEDDKDDHKLIQERLLEVAVPDETPGSQGISLENCLENYFNNRVEVRRHLERSNTLSSIRSGKQVEEKDTPQHIEVTELAWSSPNTPISDSPSTPLPMRPVNRLRTDSIIRQRVVEDKTAENADGSSDGVTRNASLRKGSLRKEVLMPAWQFFNLLPWYNRTQPAMTDEDVASHFANARPVLGICLKRYGWREDCTPFRKDTFIDIPTDTKVPHFVEDDAVTGDGPLFGNFKLSLQSVICHRGVSVNAGHYISFIRAKSTVSAGDCESDQKLDDTDGPPTYSPERWLRHDDMTYPRVAEVPDIKKALKQEMPYLLFYQVLPMHDTSPPRGPQPPAYADSGVAIKNGGVSPDTNAQPSPPARASYFEGTATPTIRLSSEFDRESEPRQSLQLPDDARRGSVAGTEGTLSSVPSTVPSNFGAASAPGTPSEETTAQRMSRAAQRFTQARTKSRPTSSSGENRISSSFTRTMNLVKSSASLNRQDSGRSEIVVPENIFTESRRGSIQFTDPSTSARPSLDDNSSRPVGESKLGRARSKRGRGREKSKEPSRDKSEGETHGHRHSRSTHRSKGKDSDAPDRECMIM